ncbi:hypothetical protein R5R35_007049 [Gryllus longicercus]|uniref:Cytochrome P450 n=1 Tax=Gryllus longicercus TaxID=2509291 RepID=A0AAN9V4M9_9ORTH
MAFILESFAEELILVLFTLCIIIYWHFTNNFDYWEKRNIPFAKPEPFFGNFKDQFFGRKSTALATQDLYKEMKGHKLAGAWRVKSPILFIQDPDLIKRVLLKDFAHFHDRGMHVDEEKNPLSANLFYLAGTRWRSLRAKLTPTFTSGKMKLMFALMYECAQEFVEFVKSEASSTGEVEFKEVFAKMTTDIIGTCAFGIQFNSMKNPDSEFRKMGRKAFSSTKKLSIQRIIQLYCPPLRKLFNSQFPPKDVGDFFIRAVSETVDYRQKNNIKRNDFLQLLLDLKNKGKLDVDDEYSNISSNDVGVENGDIKDVELTDNLLAAQAFVFFLAGFETSSTTMSFALHELTANPKILERAREEVDRVLDGTGGELSYEAIRKMEYLDNVVNESLRKYPPLPVLMRVCTKTFTEPETGALIEKGTPVQIPVYALHHDPEFYPDPARFDPDRFTEEQKAKRPNFVFLPFGEGPRVCIGLRFGMLQAKLGLAALLSRFDLAPSARTPTPLPLDPRSFITASEGGIWARVSPRSSAANV